MSVQLHLSGYRARGLAACIIGGAAVATLRSATPAAAASAGSAPGVIALNFVSGALYVAVLSPLAGRVPGAFPRRLGLIFATLYITGALTDLVEAYFFTTAFSPFTLAAALLLEAAPMLMIAVVVVVLIPPARGHSVQPVSFGASNGMWRLVLAGALYVPIYFGFAALVTPIEHQFYYDPQFIAQLQTRVPPDTVAIPLEAVRGLLFALALLPALLVLPGRSWTTWAYLGLIGAVIEGWVPLLGRTTWPAAMRLGNLAELSADAFGRAAVALALLGRPPLLLPRPPRPRRRGDCA